VEPLVLEAIRCEMLNAMHTCPTEPRREESAGFRTLPQGAVVDVEFGKHGDARVPCIVLSTPWGQVANGRRRRLTVLQSMPFEPVDSEPEFMEDVFILREGRFGITEALTFPFGLVRTIDPLVRNVMPSNPKVRSWAWNASDPELALVGEELAHVVVATFSLLWEVRNNA